MLSTLRSLLPRRLPQISRFSSSFSTNSGGGGDAWDQDWNAAPKNPESPSSLDWEQDSSTWSTGLIKSHFHGEQPIGTQQNDPNSVPKPPSAREIATARDEEDEIIKNLENDNRRDKRFVDGWNGRMMETYKLLKQVREPGVRGEYLREVDKKEMYRLYKENPEVNTVEKLAKDFRVMRQRVHAIFQRFPRPEKECQSFSLIYNDRSLDIICKDKDEAEVWFAGLKTIIARNHHRKWRTESRSDGLSSGTTSPRTYTRRSSPVSSPYTSMDNMQKDGSEYNRFRSPCGSPPKNGLDKAYSEVIYAVPSKAFLTSDSATASVHSQSSGFSDSTTNNARADGFRVSLSSAVSSSSHGSGHDDGDALGDVLIWGEQTGDGILSGGTYKSGIPSSKTDSLLPKALESAVILDVQNISCGGSHTALVTKQGEIYSWGQESGGRLGHGFDSNVLQPKLIESLSNTSIELVACGENHTCAVTLSGELYTWGNGTFGLLGHGNEVSHWVPRRVNGPLEGVHVSSISCGPWHTALVTSSGQLFTFGDGTFGALGHGDRKNVLVPREVESLKGLRTVRAACGVWHTAAVVEASNSSSSLFTWGDGDKGRLGHGDKEPKLVPTCVSHLAEQNFCQVVCGHSMTVALTTTGHVYTMGSTVYGQLGNPQADGKVPVRVEGKLWKNFVEEISCGAYHVAVLTSKGEVYTWGKGANGRLGHGDGNDRNLPTLVEALKDRQVRCVVCGTNFTAVICIHKWVSGMDQRMCSGCHQPFNFKRKRHNCYHCALVYCHCCSSKKCVKASMAPNPNKPYRVCDSCYNKLTKASETESSSQSSLNRKGSLIQGFDEITEHDDKLDTRSEVQISRYTSMQSFKHNDGRSKKNKKFEFSSSRVSPVPNGSSNWSSLNISKSLNPVFGSSKKFFSASMPGSRIVSRATSPTSRRSSPLRSRTPTPTLGGLTMKLDVDDMENSSNGLNQEIKRLKEQVENLTRNNRLQEMELEKTTKQLKEAIAIAGDETAKCKAAKEVIKSLTAQLKDMAERLPGGAARNTDRLTSSASFSTGSSSSDFSAPLINQINNLIPSHEPDSNGSLSGVPTNGSNTTNTPSINGVNGQSEVLRNGNKPPDIESNQETERVEQDEPGVYITLTSLPGGVTDLKRVRFSRKRFSEKQAEQWWAENKARVYQRYNVHLADNQSVVSM